MVVQTLKQGGCKLQYDACLWAMQRLLEVDGGNLNARQHSKTKLAAQGLADFTVVLSACFCALPCLD
jgi:hypothetical protein